MNIIGIFKKIYSNTGQSYYGVDIHPQQMLPFMDYLRLCGIEESYISNKMLRDNGNFHITVLSPINTSKLIMVDSVNDVVSELLNKEYHFYTPGIGLADKSDDTQIKKSWFVICENEELTQKLLKIGFTQDFHITLAFEPKDVFGVSKKRDSILYPINEIVKQQLPKHKHSSS